MAVTIRGGDQRRQRSGQRSGLASCGCDTALAARKDMTSDQVRLWNQDGPRGTKESCNFF
jgi:hypothetical protein